MSSGKVQLCGRFVVELDGRRVEDWIDEERRRLGELHVRALEAYASATLGVGGTELAAAVRAGRSSRRTASRATGS